MTKMRISKYLFASLLTLVVVVGASADDDSVVIDGVTYQVVPNGDEPYAWIYDAREAPITDFTIPETVEIDGVEYPVARIRGYAFNENPTLSSITFNNNMRAIEIGSFRDCPNLQTVTWPNLTGPNITEMGRVVFGGCKRLKSIWVPGNLTELPGAIFSNCDSLESVYISSNTLKKIGDEAFSGCLRLTTVILSAPNLETIGASAFAYCTALTSISIPANVTTISRRAFARCFELAEVTLPRRLTSLDELAFEYTKLTALDIPDSCATIGKEAFSFSEVMTITLPGELSALGNSCFWGCLSSQYTAGTEAKIVNLQPVPLDIADDVFDFQRRARDFTNLYVPRTSVKAYGKSLGWGFLTHIIPCDSIYLSGCRYRMDVDGCRLALYKHNLDRNMTELTIPASEMVPYSDGSYVPYAVTALCGETFSDLANLKSVTLNEVDSLGYGVFSGCSALTTIKTDRLRYIGQRAFEYCSNIKALDLPATLEKMESSAFVGNNGIERITVRAAAPPVTYYGAFSIPVYENATLYVPAESIEQYRAASGWKEFVHIEAIVDPIKGDINGDESIDGNDVSALLEMVLAGGVTVAQKAVADVSGDGSVDGNDVSALLEMVLAGE